MKKHLVVIAVLTSLLVITFVIIFYHASQRRMQQREQNEAEAKAMNAHLQQINDASEASKARIVLRSEQLERSGVKRKDLAKALSGEEAQERKELLLRSLEMH